jgi:hypothetical protein
LVPVRRKDDVMIGHNKMGTFGDAITAVIGRRVNLLLHVGLEKRVPGDLDSLCLKLNAPTSQGPRLFPVPGEVYTELDAVTQLTGAAAEVVAGGGICGAEGSIWLAVSGEPEQVDAAEKILTTIKTEPLFQL